jgi:hypothetical protein
MAVVKRAAPIFPVRDVRASLGHSRKLGFTVREYQGGGYGFANRDGVEIHLGAVPDAEPASAKHSAYLWFDDADALAHEWLAVGAEVHMPEDTARGSSKELSLTPTATFFGLGR